MVEKVPEFRQSLCLRQGMVTEMVKNWVTEYIWYGKETMW